MGYGLYDRCLRENFDSLLEKGWGERLMEDLTNRQKFSQEHRPNDKRAISVPLYMITNILSNEIWNLSCILAITRVV